MINNNKIIDMLYNFNILVILLIKVVINRSIVIKPLTTLILFEHFTLTKNKLLVINLLKTYIHIKYVFIIK